MMSFPFGSVGVELNCLRETNGVLRSALEIIAKGRPDDFEPDAHPAQEYGWWERCAREALDKAGKG